MKVKLIFFFVLLFCGAALSQAQTFKKLVEKADSLKEQNKLSDALNSYQQAIDLGLADKEKISQNEWFSTLLSAADIASKLWDKYPDMSNLARKYWSMAYGSRGEKLDEKIAFLKDYGVKDLIIYQGFSMMGQYVIGGCSSNESKFLIWLKDNKTYIQLFDECKTFKPILIKNSAISIFYPKNKSKLIQEKLNVFYRVYDTGEYNLTFIDENGVLQDTRFYEYDLISPDSNGHSSHADVEKQQLGYKKNMLTSLAKFIPILRSEIQQYIELLNSGAVRGSVGKL